MPIIPRATLISPKDQQLAKRTIKTLQQDIARLRKQLAERKSPEGRESMNNVILHKESQVNRLYSYLRTSEVIVPRPANKKPLEPFYEEETPPPPPPPPPPPTPPPPPPPPPPPAPIKSELTKAQKKEYTQQLFAVKNELKKVNYAVGRFNNDPYVRQVWKAHQNGNPTAAQELASRNTPLILVKDFYSTGKMIKLADGVLVPEMTSPMIAELEAKQEHIEGLLNPTAANLGMPPHLQNKIYESQTSQSSRLKNYVTSSVARMNRKGHVKEEGVRKAYALVRDFDKGYLGDYATAMQRIDQTLMLHLTTPNKERNSKIIRERFQREFTQMRRNNNTISEAGLEAINRAFSDYEMSKRYSSHEELWRDVNMLASQHRQSIMTQSQVQGLGVINAVKWRNAKAKVNPSIDNLNLNQLLAYEGSRNATVQLERQTEKSVKAHDSLAGAFSSTRRAMERILR